MKCSYQIANDILYSFSFQPVDSRMYLIIKNGEALVIDPFNCDEAFTLLKSQGVSKVNILLTHEHYDHISGVNSMKEQFNTEIYAIEQCAINLRNPKKNAAAHFDVLMQLAFGVEVLNYDKDYVCDATKVYETGFTYNWGSYSIKFIHTPGHSEGSVCILLNNNYVFTGDSLIKGKKVITRLPGGSKKDYEAITLPFLKSLPQDIMVFPGHGEPGILKELLE